MDEPKMIHDVTFVNAIDADSLAEIMPRGEVVELLDEGILEALASIYARGRVVHPGQADTAETLKVFLGSGVWLVRG